MDKRKRIADVNISNRSDGSDRQRHGFSNKDNEDNGYVIDDGYSILDEK